MGTANNTGSSQSRPPVPLSQSFLHPPQQCTLFGRISCMQVLQVGCNQLLACTQLLLRSCALGRGKGTQLQHRRVVRVQRACAGCGSRERIVRWVTQACVYEACAASGP